MAPHVRAHPGPFPSEADRNSSEVRLQTAALFEVNRLSVVYPRTRGQGPIPVLDDVSFSPAQGRSLTLVGSSGSGESTLLRCLNRLEEPTHGMVRFNGCDVRSIDPRELRQHAAWSCKHRCCSTERSATTSACDPSHTAPTRRKLAWRTHSRRLDRLATSWTAERKHSPLARSSGLPLLERFSRIPTRCCWMSPPRLSTRQTLHWSPKRSCASGRRVRSLVAVTHQTDLVRKLGGHLLYLVGGRVHAYTCMDGVDPSALADTRLQAFLAGELTSRLEAHEK